MEEAGEDSTYTDNAITKTAMREKQGLQSEEAAMPPNTMAGSRKKVAL